MSLRKRSPRSSNRFGLERLEARQLMAGDVATVFQDGHLTLNEASGQAGLDNAVTISQLGNGMIHVQGAMNADGTITKIDGADSGNLKVTTNPEDLADCDLIVEAIAEELEIKGPFMKQLAEAAPGADLATTTSSLRIGDVAGASGTEDRLYGLHVFNPVPRMALFSSRALDHV